MLFNEEIVSTLENVAVIYETERVHGFIKIQPDIVLYFLALYRSLCVAGLGEVYRNGLFDLALYSILRFGGELRQNLDVDARLLEHLAHRSLLKGLALLNMTLGEAPMGAAPVFDEQISYLVIDPAINHRTARTLVETLELIVPALFGKGHGVLDLIGDESHAFGGDDIDRRAAVAAPDGGDNSAVKSPHRVGDAHDICPGGGAVISLFAFDNAEIKLINESELSVYGADRVCDPYSDIFAEHFNHTFRTAITASSLYEINYN